MTRIRKRLSLAVALAALLAIPAGAQNALAPAQVSQKIYESSPQGWPFSFGPMGLSEIQQRVGLSDAQMRQIFQIYEQNRTNLNDLRVEVEKRERDLQVVLDTPALDLGLAERAVDEVLEARNRLAKSATMMMVRMRQVMTQEQWHRMEELQRQSTLTSAQSAPFPPTAAKRLRVGSAVQARKLISQAKPVYPRLAKQGRIQGAVLLEALLDVNGAVSQLRVVSGHPLLVQAALEAVRQWRYEQTLLNNEPVEVVTVIDVVFTLLY